VKKRYANRFMGVTPSTSQEVSHREREVLRVFAQYTFRRVLDIGCGDGNFSLLFGKASGSEELFGVDISETAVKLASSKGVRAFQVNVDLEDLPFEGDSFDAIFCGETLEHLFDPDHLIEEAFRVLKPGGLFIVTTPNLASLYNRVSLLLGFQPFDTSVSLRYDIGHLLTARIESPTPPGADHIRVFAYGALLKLLRLHGFTVVSARGSGPIGRQARVSLGLRCLIGLSERLLGPLPQLSHRVLVLCVKPAVKPSVSCCRSCS